MAIVSDLSKFDHIPLSDIERDIADTQVELDQYERELTALEGDRVKNRLSIYMAEGHISGRKSFIKNLEQIVKYRKNN